VTGDFLGTGSQRAGFVLLVAFLGSWIFIRTSARLIRDPKVTWWPGSVETKEQEDAVATFARTTRSLGEGA